MLLEICIRGFELKNVFVDIGLIWVEINRDKFEIFEYILNIEIVRVVIYFLFSWFNESIKILCDFR